jgi:anti-sigma B factor antagonist
MMLAPRVGSSRTLAKQAAPRNLIIMSSLKFQEIEDVLVVYFTDAKILDETRIAQIGQELMTAVGSASQKKMLVNFQGVQFMSSAMIGKLVLLSKKCKTDEVTLKLCCIQANVMEVFKITRLNKVFEIHDTEDKAVKSFGKGKGGWFG